MIHCPSCAEVPVPEDQLPVALPADLDFQVQGSPLDQHPTWKHDVVCPSCGSEDAVRDVDTLDTFVDSSWYFLRYLSPADDSQAWPVDAAGSWLPVDQYTGASNTRCCTCSTPGSSSRPCATGASWRRTSRSRRC
jgi:leucyl-tRNA synthetase